jgi:hypothetical protein
VLLSSRLSFLGGHLSRTRPAAATPRLRQRARRAEAFCDERPFTASEARQQRY